MKTATTRGLREGHALVFLCLETREAVISSATEHAHSACGGCNSLSHLCIPRPLANESGHPHPRPCHKIRPGVGSQTKRSRHADQPPAERLSQFKRAEANASSRQSKANAWRLSSFPARLTLIFCSASSLSMTTRSGHTCRGTISPPKYNVSEEIESLPLDQIAANSHIGRLIK